MKHKFSPNDILIGTTTVIEASHLVANTTTAWPSSTQYKTLRLLELCALAEAVILHDTLFTLRSQLPYDADTLQLRQQLLDAGILKEIRSPIAFQETIPQITEWITNAIDQPMDKDSIAVIKEFLMIMGDRRYSYPVIHSSQFLPIEPPVCQLDDDYHIFDE